MIYDEVLNELVKNPDGFSGEELALRLKISRNAVWKAINRLRRDGYVIEGSTNRGYRLISAPDILNGAEIQSYLKVSAELELHKTIGSTNTRAKEVAESEPQYEKMPLFGRIIISDSQTAGRGRYGRKFVSNASCGIYMSFLLHPSSRADEAIHITTRAAVAVAEAIESLADVDVGIKWVNDLLINGKKICGILTEASIDFESGGLKYAVLGIGINVGQTVFPDDVASVASSIEAECGRKISRNRLCAEVINRVYTMLSEGGTEYMNEYRRRSVAIGREVTVIRGDERYYAKVAGIDDNGRLEIEADGKTVKLSSGEISIKI